MVLTAYTCMVVGQKTIEAKGCVWLRQHSATTDIALVNGHLVIRFDFNFGLVITAAVVWCGVFVYRFIRAYRNTDGD